MYKKLKLEKRNRKIAKEDEIKLGKYTDRLSNSLTGISAAEENKL